MGPALAIEFFGSMGLMLCVNIKQAWYAPALFYFMFYLMLGRISGGHINPAISLGVYTQQRKYVANLCFLILLIIAQILGAGFALAFGFLLRVSLPVPNSSPQTYYFIPDVKGMVPPILLSADGYPAFGQVMLAEIIGGMIFTMTVLYCKRFQYHYRYDRVVSAIPIPIALIGIYQTFGEISGSDLNPATALASIVWQNLTYMYDQNGKWSQWTYEYAICYILGPFIGAWQGGHLFNLLVRYEDAMDKDTLEAQKNKTRKAPTDDEVDDASSYSYSQGGPSHNRSIHNE